jgi:hypothetical protein
MKIKTPFNRGLHSHRDNVRDAYYSSRIERIFQDSPQWDAEVTGIEGIYQERFFR